MCCAIPILPVWVITVWPWGPDGRNHEGKGGSETTHGLDLAGNPFYHLGMIHARVTGG